MPKIDNKISPDDEKNKKTETNTDHGNVVINMCDFMSYGVFTTYFQTFMQVAVRTSASKASMIDNTLRIVFQVTALVVGLVMRFWTPACVKLGLGKRLFHTRYPVWIGIPLCALSIGIGE